MRHLIHIGYPKAASTFLQEWFSCHPELKFNNGGLASFYHIYDICREAVQKTETNFKYYVTSYEGLVSPRVSAGYYPVETGLIKYTQPGYREPQEKICEMLKDLFPNSQILLITRGFKKLVLSAYSQYVRCGGILSWETFAEKYLESDLQTFNEFFDYEFIYNLYAKSFGEENIIVLPYELLRDNKLKFISLIEERLGLNHFEDKICKINESLSVEELFWYPRISYRVSKLVQMFGMKRYHQIYSWYIHQTNNQRLKKIAQMLCYLRKPTEISASQHPNFIKKTVGKAEVFRHNQLYQPYLHEYFLD